jgi:hypothetical protein
MVQWQVVAKVLRVFYIGHLTLQVGTTKMPRNAGHRTPSDATPRLRRTGISLLFPMSLGLFLH